MKKIAVLMTVFNRREITLKCLRILYKQKLPTGFTIDTYLTDDGSTDGTSEAIKQEFPLVKIVEGDGNLFWNRGTLKAWSEAEKKNYDFYLWLNDDTELLEGAIEELIHSYERYSKDTIIVGYTLSSDLKEVTYGPSNKNGRVIKEFNGIIPCPTFNGNIVLIPREAYNLLGKNDSYYTHGLGDNDYGLRANEKGIIPYTTSKAIGICDRHISLPKWCNRDVPVLERLKYLYKIGPNGHNPFEYCRFQRKHFGLFSAIAVFLSLHLHALLPIIWDKILKRRAL